MAINLWGLTMHRQTNVQDVTWFLDLESNGQLDLDPPYQRKSVWTLKDRRFFLDTVFRNYPCPPVFLHKSLDESGRSTYHVVDGKQRLQAIIAFVKNEYSLDKSYGDSNLDGKYWKEVPAEYKKKLWNYVVSVEYIDDISDTTVNEVFDRVNRNQKKLERQELRHAKYVGWFVTEAEKEAQDKVWVTYGVGSTANVRRMRDIQFISELMLVILEADIRGFDQDILDAKYAEYDDPATVSDFDEDDYRDKLSQTKQLLDAIQKHNGAISDHAKNSTHFYTLWAYLTLYCEGIAIDQFADQYAAFMASVKEAGKDPGSTDDPNVLTYLTNSQGASTDLKKRKGRLDALKAALAIA